MDVVGGSHLTNQLGCMAITIFARTIDVLAGTFELMGTGEHLSQGVHLGVFRAGNKVGSCLYYLVLADHYLIQHHYLYDFYYFSVRYRSSDHAILLLWSLTVPNQGWLLYTFSVPQFKYMCGSLPSPSRWEER